MSGHGSTNGRRNRDLLRRTLKGPNRRHRRYVTQSLLVDNPVVGRVVNVGQAGFAIESLEGLNVGESYLFKVRLGDKHLRLPGRIQWCRLTATKAAGETDAKPIYKAGVALAETVASKAWREALKRMTDDSAYVIWHKARGRSGESAADLVAAKTAAPSAGQVTL